MTEKELLHVMQNVNSKYSDEAQMRASAAQMPVRRRTGMRLGLFAVGAAACLGLTVIAVLPKHSGNLSVASTDLTDEVAEVEITESEAEEAAVKEQISEQKQIAAAKPEKESGKPASEAEKTAGAPADEKAETKPEAEQSAETQPAGQQSEAQQPAQTTAASGAQEQTGTVIGDFDLDGQFTLADGVLCNLIYFAERNDVMDMIPLTDAQLRQADLISGCVWNDDPSLPLGYDEYQAILKTLHLIYSYNLTGITPLDYLADQNYYDDYSLYRSPRLVRSLPIDWASIGLTGDFTEEDFWKVVSPEYALECYEAEYGQPEDVGDFLNQVRVTQSKYLEMVYTVPEKWMPPIVEYGVAGEFCFRYTALLHRQKFGEPGYEPVYPEPVDPVLVFSEDELTPEMLRKMLADAKTWTIDTAPDPRS